MALVRVRSPLKELAGGHPEHELEGATVAEALRAFERANPAAAGWILDERGMVRRHINVFVNGELARDSAPVHARDRIEILPAISGGSGERRRMVSQESRAGAARAPESTP